MQDERQQFPAAQALHDRPLPLVELRGLLLTQVKSRFHLALGAIVDKIQCVAGGSRCSLRRLRSAQPGSRCTDVGTPAESVQLTPLLPQGVQGSQCWEGSSNALQAERDLHIEKTLNLES